MSDRPPLVVIGVDALDVDLFHRWMAEGRMPFLASLRDGAAFARLDSTKDLFGDAPWPSLNAGVSPATHAFYTHLQLRRGTLDIERIDARDCRAYPFWQYLRGTGLTSLIIDVPKTFFVDGLDGIQVCGWGEHYPLLRSPESSPPELIDEIHRTYGEYPHPPENNRPPSREWEIQQRELYHENIARKQRALDDLIQRQDWDFFFAVFSELHYADHQFLHHLDPGHWAHEPDAPEILRDCLPSVAERTDEAIRALFDKLPPDANWFIVSVHGIEPNFTANHVMDEVLKGLGYLVPTVHTTASNPIGRLLRATEPLRRMIPQSIRDRINRRLPDHVHDQADSSAFEGSWDWERTRAFLLPSDHFQALISLNLEGREPRGLVKPGAEADALLEEIGRELLRLTNPATGRPAVAGVVKTADVYEGPRLAELPDLVVQWAKDAPIDAVEHRSFGTIQANQTVVRKAQHSPDGFLMGGGPGVASESEAVGGRTLDFAPTMLHLLGQPVPDELEGRVLHELLAPASREALAG